LADGFKVDEDFRSFYWMNKFQEPGLYPDDKLRGYKYLTIGLPWGELPLYFYSLGYDLLFYAASFFVSPILFSKLLPFLLMPAVACCLFNYGRSVESRRVGITLAAGFVFLNLASPTSLSVVSGLQRSFASPLMIALLCFLRQRRYVAAAGIILASALVYPPVFLLGTATWGLFSLSLIVTSPSWTSVREELAILLIVFLLGAILLSPILPQRILNAPGLALPRSQPSQASGGPQPVRDNPKYEAGGRNPLFEVFPIIGRAGLVTKPLTAVHLSVLIAIGALIYLVRPATGSLHVPRELWCLIIASLVLFAAAWVSLLLTGSFALYLPSRYSRVGLFLFCSAFVLLNVEGAVKDAARLFRTKGRMLIWLIGGTEVFLLGFILLYPSRRAAFLGVDVKWLLASASLLLVILTAVRLGRPSANGSQARLGQSRLGRVLICVPAALGLIGWGVYARAVGEESILDPSAAERELLAYLETLPKDVMLAGTPCALDNVPLFAKRQILFSCEQVSRDREMMRKALDAYYAEDAEPVFQFCEEYQVAYLVANSWTYTEEYLDKGWIFFEPYNEELLPRVTARDSFVLANVLDRVKVFQVGDLFVLPCTRSALGE
jgi:hypothetical protein